MCYSRQGLIQKLVSMQMHSRLPGGRQRLLDTDPALGINFCLVVLLLLGSASRAVAQELTPQPLVGTAGGLPAPSQLPIISGSPNATAKVHMSLLGKPCVTVQGYAQPQIVNPKIFDHMIVANNDCGQVIKMQVCYYHSTECTPLDLPAYGRKQMVLGIMPAMNQFRFEYREQFD
jgi:hypothetical protein